MKIFLALLLALITTNIFAMTIKSINYDGMVHISKPVALRMLEFEVGDIIDIKEDGQSWGGSDPRINPLSCLVIIQVTDMTLAEFMDTQWAQPQYNLTDPDNPFRIRKRQFKIDKNDKIPNNIINYIENNDGFVQFDKATLNNWITDKDGQL